jgi:insertion element IS1 protein InsB
MWSFVGSKQNKQWVRLAIDADSREIVGAFVESRSRHSATKLWQSLPAVYRQCGICYTDFWEAYEQVPRPQASEKPLAHQPEKPVTQERFNNTRRQRLGRLVRKTLSFSKKLSNHIGAIWYFVHHYNASLRS